MDRYFRGSWKNTIAVVLILAALIAIMSPLLTVSVKWNGIRYSLSEIIDATNAARKKSSIEFKAEIMAELADLGKDVMKETGESIPTEKLGNYLLRVLDGRISLLDAALFCSAWGSSAKVIEKATDDFSQIIISRTGNSLITAGIAAWIILAALVLSAIYAVFSLSKGGKYGTVIFTAVTAVTVLCGAIVVSKLNDLLTALLQGFFFWDILEDLAHNFHVDTTVPQRLDLFHLGIAPVLALIFSAAASVLVLIQEGTSAGSTVPWGKHFRKLGGWTCSCGSWNKSGSSFCAVCGKVRPKEERCVCGAAVLPGTAYCGKCGRRLSSDSPVPSPPPPPPVSKISPWKTPSDSDL